MGQLAFELKPQMFREWGRLVLTPTWVSNGHWAVRREFCGPSAAFKSVEAAEAWAGSKVRVVAMESDGAMAKCVEAATVEYVVSKWSLTEAVKSHRWVQGPEGTGLLLQEGYMDVLKVAAGEKGRGPALLAGTDYFGALVCGLEVPQWVCMSVHMAQKDFPDGPRFRG